ncbi:MAG: hypothetical protein HY928_16355 [Elusimicrobia bacterium]|nr:hypothetical protein [Elusimicrobiota bacterium]
MALRHERAGAVLVLAAAAWVLAPARPWPSADCLFGEATYHAAGTALLHGASGPVSAAYHMPGASLATACLKGRASSGQRRAWQAFARSGPAVLAAAAGTAAGSLASGVAAGAALLWAAPEPACHPQALLSVLVVLLALVLPAWARRPDKNRSLLAAAALGTALCLRSTLAFLPPLLAVWAWRRRERAGAFVVGLLPYAAVLPWVAAHLSAGGGLHFFEAGQAGNNIIAGALGMVGTFEGDVSALGSGLPNPLNFLETASWAVGHILSHPGRFLDAVVLRLSFVVGLEPVLWAAAAWGFCLTRRRPRTRVWALLAVYLAIVHAAMAVQENYFVPLWPVLALLAASPLGRGSYRLGALAESAARALAWAVCAVALAGGVFAGAAAMTTALRYGVRARGLPPESREALERAVSEAPDDALLREWRGRRRLVGGDLAGAREDFAAAAAGGLGEARMLESWTRRLSGEAVPFEEFPGLACAQRALAGLMRSEVLARDGSLDAARAEARSALEARASCAFARGPVGSAGALLASQEQGIRSLLAELKPLVPRGLVLSAPRYLESALPAPASAPAAWRALALGLQDLGDLEGSLALSGRLDGAGALADRGVALALAGRGEEAEAQLARALELDPAQTGAALTLGALLESQGKAGEAKAVYDKALAASRGPLRAELQRRLGR